MTKIDYVKIPAKLLEMLASLVGCPTTVEAASDAAEVAHSGDWTSALDHSCRRAGLKAAVFSIHTLDELERLTTLGTPSVTRLAADRPEVLERCDYQFEITQC